MAAVSTPSTSPASCATAKPEDPWGTQAKADYMWDWTRPFIKHAMANVALKANMSILDVGAGTGSCCIPLAERVRDENIPGAVIRATDISPGMLATLTKLATDAGVAHLITTHEDDAQQLASPAAEAASYDLVTCMFTLMLVPRPTDAMNELARMLKPGGQLVATLWARSGLAEALPILLKEHELSADTAAADVMRSKMYAVGHEDNLRSLLAGAGLQEIAIEKVTLPVSLARWHRVVPFLIRNPAMAEAFKGHSDEALTQMLMSMPEHPGIKDSLGSCEAVVLKAQKPVV